MGLEAGGWGLDRYPTVEAYYFFFLYPVNLVILSNAFFAFFAS